MRAEHQFTVPAPVDLVWTLLTDRESVLACVPGLKPTGSGPRSVEGTLRLRIRPGSATFHGSGQLTGRDDAAHGLTIQLEGSQLRGSGILKADIEITAASANGSGTVVTVGTEFAVTGSAADAGGAAVEAAVGRLLTRFGANVLEALTVETGLPAADLATEPAPGSVGPVSAPARPAPDLPSVDDEAAHSPAPNTPAAFSRLAAVPDLPTSEAPPVFDIAALPVPTRRFQAPSLAAAGRAAAVVAAAVGALAVLHRLRDRGRSRSS